jgi:hypothetical protein
MAYHLLPGFRVRLAKTSKQDHWQGGPVRHTGVNCPICRRPFLLLWDINCRDPRFVVENRAVFKDLKRLPLYYCWTCVAEMDYQVCDDDRIRLFSHTGEHQGKDFPYRSYPKEFERSPLEMDRMPQTVRELLKGIDIIKRLTKQERNTLEKWIGHPLKFAFDIWWHQFGGLPWLAQGPERVNCPNPECSWSRRGWPMKILAAIQNDPIYGLPMTESKKEIEKGGGHFNHWVQVTFHICRNCLTIHAANRCD